MALRGHFIFDNWQLSYYIQPMAMKNRYVRAAVVPLPDGLEAIGKNNDRTMLGGHEVGVSSLRLRTFKSKGACCAYCGLKATHFAIEKCQGSKLELYHMNLWGMRDGAEILFTHDHVHARGLGGADNIDNSVTACESCNNRKARYEASACNYIRTRNEQAVSFAKLLEVIDHLFGVDNLKVQNFFRKFA